MQFLFSPAFVALFFASLLTLEGRPKDIVPKLKQVRSTSSLKLGFKMSTVLPGCVLFTYHDYRHSSSTGAS